MHVYQMRSSNKTIVQATEQRLSVCMNALKEVSKVWLVAKMVHTLFESILGNKLLEERLQKAAGKRHKKPPPLQTTRAKEEPPKRKFDEMNDMGFANGPAPNVSYERSRPQTPALTPSRELPQQQQGQQNNGNGHGMNHPGSRQPSDPFAGIAGGQSRGNTRPTTPFNQYAFPGTPPELFLVTRNSPNLSSDLWQNFQPDQLFPNEANVTFPHISPVQQHSNLVDPALSGGQRPMGNNGMMGGGAQQQHGMPMQGNNGMPMNNGGDPNAWSAQQHQMDPLNQPAMQGDDTWSNSSRGQGPIVPTTLNVEDWYAFLTYRGDGGAGF